MESVLPVNPTTSLAYSRVLSLFNNNTTVRPPPSADRHTAHASSQGNVFESDWKNGLSIGPGAARGELTFPDGLVYGEKDWDYCSPDDRRFYSERVNGLQPAGRSQLTDKGNRFGWRCDQTQALRFHLTVGSTRRYGGSRVPTLFIYTSIGPLTNIPVGTYDVGDGYFDPSANEVFAYDGTPLRKPTAEQADWAKRCCRLGK